MALTFSSMTHLYVEDMNQRMGKAHHVTKNTVRSIWSLPTTRIPSGEPTSVKSWIVSAKIA